MTPDTSIEAPQNTSSPLRKALRGAVIAATVGVATGLLCGMFMEPLAGALLGADAAKVFAAFPSSTMALFFGITSAVSAFFTNGLESSIEAYRQSRSRGHPQGHLPEDELTASLQVSRSATISAPPLGTESSVVIVKPPITVADHIPTTAVMQAIHDSRLQQAAEIATIKLH